MRQIGGYLKPIWKKDHDQRVCGAYMSPLNSMRRREALKGSIDEATDAGQAPVATSRLRGNRFR
jgi:hypothetical protein